LTKSLDPTQIASLLQQDDKEQQTKKAAQIKRKNFPTEPRTYDTWFALPTHFGACTNASCVDPRDNKLGKAMVADVNGGDICRYCFLEGVNKPSDV
jgi:hypothetical protein